jgi:hypothetical protein
MKKFILIIVITLLINGLAFSQDFSTDSISKSEITKLEFLVGNWEGNGWLMGRDRTKSEFNQTEKIQFKLDSTAILIEGVGKSNGMITHNAMAIITYNKSNENYTFQSYLQNGRKGEFKGELIENKFYWYPSENMRYIIWLNEKGQWYETGEFNREGKWFQFFEMTLNKIK